MTAALCIACAVWLWIPSSQGLARLTLQSRDLYPKWIQPVPGAAPLRIRVIGGSCVGLLMLLLLGGRLLVVFLALVIGVGATIGMGKVASSSHKQLQEKEAWDLPQALDLMVAGLEAGLPLRIATQAVATVFDGPVHERLIAVAARVAVGEKESQAWRISGDAETSFGRMSSDIARSLDSGTALAPTLYRHSVDARSEHRARVESNAKAIGVRSVWPTMLCFLPAFLLTGVVPIIAGVALQFF
ncbi:MAG: type II secretion system F family protein [Propionibacteriaceae bacterium]